MYTVELTVTDDDGAAVSDTCLVTVKNVAPRVNLGIDIVVMEGDPVSLNATAAVTDPGLDTHAYQWQVFSDNGHSVQGGTASTLGFSPIDNGTYVVRLTVTDDDGQSGYDNLIVSAHNMPPQDVTFQWIMVQRNTGTEFTATGSFTDPGADTFRATIDYGDGTRMPLALANRTFTTKHVYRQAGIYDVVVSVVDDDKGTSSYEAQVDTGGNPYPFHNSALPCDVNDDGLVSPIDVLIVVNYMNQHGAGPLPSPALKAPPPYLDVNRDGYVSPHDALLVVICLNKGLSGEGESEILLHTREISLSNTDELSRPGDSTPPLPGIPAPVTNPEIALAAVESPANAGDRLARSNWSFEYAASGSFSQLVDQQGVSYNLPDLELTPQQALLPRRDSRPAPLSGQAPSALADLALRDLEEDSDLEDLLEQISADIGNAWQADLGEPILKGR